MRWRLSPDYGVVGLREVEVEQQPILVIDNGTHYLGQLQRALHLIRLRFRLHRGDSALLDLNLEDAGGIILTGGKFSVYQPDELEQVRLSCDLIELGSLPILGLCLGCQLIAHVFGGTIQPLPAPVDRPVDIQVLASDPLFEGLPAIAPMVMAHGDTIIDGGPELRSLARSEYGEYEAIRHRTRPSYGVQFHPEVSGELGRRILANFGTLCAGYPDAGVRATAV